jgi:hypothetical protein
MTLDHSAITRFELRPIGVNGSLEAEGDVSFFCDTSCLGNYPLPLPEPFATEPLGDGLGLPETVCCTCGKVLVPDAH